MTDAAIDFGRWRRERNRRYWAPADGELEEPVEIGVCQVCAVAVFDDPNGERKGEVVRMLDDHGATDGFACQGVCADRYPQVVAAAEAAHSYVPTVDELLDADDDRDVWHTSLADLRREDERLNPPTPPTERAS